MNEGAVSSYEARARLSDGRSDRSGRETALRLTLIATVRVRHGALCIEAVSSCSVVQISTNNEQLNIHTCTVQVSKQASKSILYINNTDNQTEVTFECAPESLT